MRKTLKKDRAWIEINSKNLENNINEIRKIIPQSADILAIVKANAYGCGMIEIAQILNKIGIQNFGVATLAEGLKLRKNNINGNILILGYTEIKDLEDVIKYDLMQTIVDYTYAQKIEEMKLNEKLNVHIKINTGMNRIGEKYKNIDNIIKMYDMKNINVNGIYTHLSVSESLEKCDVDFTNEQISRFYNCVEQIQKAGYNPGKTHIQNSYGILNYSNTKCDYVRPGIIMYGAQVDNATQPEIKLSIKPVLSLKARITSVKQIEAGEPVSYDRTYIADTGKKIATVSIGYADGYPRNLSGKNTKVYVNKQYTEIIGKICMDQLIIDVTNIKNVQTGDIVTLIGEEPEITVEKISEKAETITNEVLSRLGDRLERIVF